MFDFNHYYTKLKHHDDSNKFIVCKMNDEIGHIAIDEFVRLN